jgi:hypothetical protein
MSKIPAVESYVRWMRRSVDDAIATFGEDELERFAAEQRRKTLCG